MDSFTWYRRGKERALDSMEAGEISYQEYRILQREAFETFAAMRNSELEDDLEDELAE